MNTRKRNRNNVQGISWKSKEFLDAAKARAARLDISLSKYVNRLVKRDLEAGGPMIPQESVSSDPVSGRVEEKALQMGNLGVKQILAQQSTHQTNAGKVVPVEPARKAREKKP